MADVAISSIQDLVSFANGDYGRGTSSAYLDVVLTADIDFNDLNEYDSPYNWAGCTGTWYINLDGQGHKIDNIYYAGSADWGFFGTVYGFVKNLYLTNMFVTSARVVAGVVVNLMDNSVLENIKVSGHLENVSTNNDLTCCGLYFYARNAKVIMCSVSGTLKGGSACGLGRNCENGRTYIFSCMVYADITAIGNSNCAGLPFASINTTVTNCEYRGDVKCPNGASILVGGWEEYILSCLLIYGAGTSGSWRSNSSYSNVYYDSTLATEGGFTPPSITGAPTTDLQSAQWLHDHDFAI